MKILGLFLLIVSVCFSAIAPDSSGFHGSWRYEDNARVTVVSYMPDGKFSGSVKSKEGQPEWRFSGDWVREGSVITYTYRWSSLHEGPISFVDRDQILEQTDKELVLKDLDDGIVYRCHRLGK
ncbi:MAG: hypothetical protein QM760_00845 [Nibricoccus sp.]